VGPSGCTLAVTKTTGTATGGGIETDARDGCLRYTPPRLRLCLPRPRKPLQSQSQQHLLRFRGAVYKQAQQSTQELHACEAHSKHSPPVLTRQLRTSHTHSQPPMHKTQQASQTSAIVLVTPSLCRLERRFLNAEDDGAERVTANSISSSNGCNGRTHGIKGGRLAGFSFIFAGTGRKGKRT
jgi:hypothetical protein